MISALTLDRQQIRDSTVKNTLFGLSALAMLAAPVAANAGTNAAASSLSAGKIASLKGVGERKSAGVKAKNNADAGVTILGVLAAGAAGFGVYKAVDDNKSNGS